MYDCNLFSLGCDDANPLDAIPMLTLLTDFGLRDPYVAVMKGVIAQINPQLSVIDLTHRIPPQDILAGRFALMTAFPYFPVGTVHVAVVDPGVGTSRRAIAVAVGEPSQPPLGFLVGPDNGLFSGVISQQQVIAAVELTEPQYWRVSQPSLTFHGRDIFAPVGAHVASGVSLERLGSATSPESLIKLELPALTVTDQGISGHIQAIDHFGNIVTTIPGHAVAERPWLLTVSGHHLRGHLTYGHCARGDLVALVGSHGWVEIAVNGGNAHARLNLGWGEPIHVVWD